MELLKKLNSIKGISLSTDDIESTPHISLLVLDQDARKQFLQVMEWVLKAITGEDNAGPRRQQAKA